MKDTSDTPEKNTPREPREPRTLRWPADIRAKMKRAALLHRRTFTDEVLAACDHWLLSPSASVAKFQC